MSDSKIVIEKNIRFSQSSMWHDQKNYYDQKGIEAWDEDVPFYITSNPFIARDYAKMLIAFMQDWILKNPDAKKNPFVILELGAGTGQFSFYVLKHFIDMQAKLKLHDIKIQYVMSDVTSRHFEFWSEQPQLKPFIESGLLDFCIFDLYHETEINLHHAKKVISAEQMHNPLIIIANYLFDSIANDVFTADDGKLFEALATIETSQANIKEGRPVDFEKIKITYQPTLIENSYYHNEFDAVLFDYADTLADTHFQFPIAGLQALKNLQALSHNKLLLLSSDKGYTNLEELENCDYPELDYHGSFSVMVNYHAIGGYLKNCKGDYRIQSFRANMVTGAFSSGFSFDGFSQFNFTTEHVLNEFSPTDYFLIYEHFLKEYKKCTLEEMASYFNLSNWDPHLFDQVNEYFLSIAEDGDPEAIQYLAQNMSRIEDHFYYLPSATDTLFNIALFYQEITDFDEAISYYEKSLRYFGDSDATFFNIAMCYYHLDRKSDALAYLQKSLDLNSDAHDVREWIDVVSKGK